MRIGYVRVSSVDQNTARQLEGVQVDKIFSDHAKATAKAEREGKHVKPTAIGDKCGFCGHYRQGCSGQEKAAAACV